MSATVTDALLEDTLHLGDALEVVLVDGIRQHHLELADPSTRSSRPSGSSARAASGHTRHSRGVKCFSDHHGRARPLRTAPRGRACGPKSRRACRSAPAAQRARSGRRVRAASGIRTCTGGRSRCRLRRRRLRRRVPRGHSDVRSTGLFVAATQRTRSRFVTSPERLVARDADPLEPVDRPRARRPSREIRSRPRRDASLKHRPLLVAETRCAGSTPTASHAGSKAATEHPASSRPLHRAAETSPHLPPARPRPGRAGRRCRGCRHGSCPLLRST